METGKENGSTIQFEWMLASPFLIKYRDENPSNNLNE